MVVSIIEVNTPIYTSGGHHFGGDSRIVKFKFKRYRADKALKLQDISNK